MADLLDAADDDLAFNPDDIEFNSSSVMDLDGEPAKPKPKFQPVLSLAEQLAA